MVEKMEKHEMREMQLKRNFNLFPFNGNSNKSLLKGVSKVYEITLHFWWNKLKRDWTWYYTSKCVYYCRLDNGEIGL